MVILAGVTGQVVEAQDDVGRLAVLVRNDELREGGPAGHELGRDLVGVLEGKDFDGIAFFPRIPCRPGKRNRCRHDDLAYSSHGRFLKCGFAWLILALT